VLWSKSYTTMTSKWPSLGDKKTPQLLEIKI